MAPASALLAALPQFPPTLKPPISKQPPSVPTNPSPSIPSRRYAVFLPIIALVSQPAPATAFSIGISGPKEWLKEQKRKSSKFLLAPIYASRESLRSASILLKDTQSGFADKEAEEVQRLLKSAARDCVPQQRDSFVALQAVTGVEVCTFRLIVKNAASLLDKKDPVKLEAEAMLEDLVRSFSFLNGLANTADIQFTSSREKVVDALMDTISSLNRFEQSVKDCLEV